jgi:Ca2+/Na+ antiporter
MWGCFDNFKGILICALIFTVFSIMRTVFLYCFIYVYLFILISSVCTSVKTTATEFKLNYSYYYYYYCLQRHCDDGTPIPPVKWFPEVDITYFAFQINRQYNAR